MALGGLRERIGEHMMALGPFLGDECFHGPREEFPLPVEAGVDQI
jgi:hypothetical protein